MLFFKYFFEGDQQNAITAILSACNRL